MRHAPGAVRPPVSDSRMRRHGRHAIFAAFVLLVGAHLVVLTQLALDAGPGGILPVLLAVAALFGLSALSLAWGTLVRGNGLALIGALAALALYSAAALVVAIFPAANSAAPDDDPLARIVFYLALLWTLALAGLAMRRCGPS